MVESFRSRRVVGVPQKGGQHHTSGVGAQPQRSVPLVSPQALINRRKPRSGDLLRAFRAIDTAVDRSAQLEIMRSIRDEYERRQGGVLLGCLQQCYLGPPFVDHKLDLLHDIVEHYHAADAVADPFAQARGLVRSGSYAYIEVYSDGALVPVRPDGSCSGGGIL